MNATSSLLIRCLHCAVVLGCLGLLSAVVLGETAEDQKAKAPDKEQAAKQKAKDAAKMVEAIANRNKPPTFLRLRGYLPKYVPLYPKNYDWREEERVREALAKLDEDTSEELWEALVAKANDSRYCVATYTGNTSDVKIRSVGDVCRQLAYGRLSKLFEKHLPSYPPHGCPIDVGSEIKDFPEWRKARKDKSLYELQIEACQIALRKLAALAPKEMSDKEKAEARKKIDAEIKDLQRTKEPCEENARGTPRSYPRREADRVREAYEKKTLEKFESGLNR